MVPHPRDKISHWSNRWVAVGEDWSVPGPLFLVVTYINAFRYVSDALCVLCLHCTVYTVHCCYVHVCFVQVTTCGALFYCYLTFLDDRTNISKKVCAPRRVSASGAPNKFQNCHLDKTNMDKTSQHHSSNLCHPVRPNIVCWYNMAYVSPWSLI